MTRHPAGCLAALLLSAMLGGCISPRYRRPDVPIPPDFRGATQTPAANTAAAGLGELRWQDLIQDPDLQKLIQEALANNLDARMAAARVLEARAQLTASRSARLPAVDAHGSYTNLRSAQNGSSTIPSTVLPYAEYTDLSLGASWELDFWGRIRNATVAARANLLAGEEARRTVIQSLVNDVAGAYLLLLDLDREVEITRRALELRQVSLELVRLRTDNGYSPEIDLRQAEVLVETAHIALTGLELDAEQAENRLAILLGRNPGPIVRGRRSLLDQAFPPRLPAGLPSTLLDRRPDIRQAEQELIGSHALVAVARAAYFPTLSLTASTGFESSALRHLFDGPNRTWTFVPAGALPVFNAGRVRAGVRAAEARRQQAMLAYQRTVQQAFREVADALAASRKLAELRSQQEGLVESLHQAVELADLRYRGGVASYLEYLDSERQMLDEELRLVQIRRQELTNVVALYRALGGGWQ